MCAVVLLLCVCLLLFSCVLLCAVPVEILCNAVWWVVLCCVIVVCLCMFYFMCSWVLFGNYCVVMYGLVLCVVCVFVSVPCFKMCVVCD